MNYKLIGIIFFSLTVLGSQNHYTGEFDSIVSSGPACDSIFASQKYRVSHYISGPTHLTSVIHLKAIQEGSGTKMTLVGNNDGWGRLQVSQEHNSGKYTYKTVASGLYDWQFLVLDFEVKAFESTIEICTVKGQLSAFK